MIGVLALLPGSLHSYNLTNDGELMSNTKSLVYIALFAALIAVLGLLPKFNLAGGVPITAQSMGIMLAGIMLGPVRGFLAVALFVLVMSLGAPILAGGRGGLGVYATASVGFIIGFPFAALAAGWVMQAMRPRSVFVSALVAAIIGGIVVLYVFGIPGWAWTVGKDIASVAKASLVFIPGDLIKAVIAALIAQAVYKAMPEALISRR